MRRARGPMATATEPPSCPTCHTALRVAVEENPIPYLRGLLTRTPPSKEPQLSSVRVRRENDGNRKTYMRQIWENEETNLPQTTQYNKVPIAICHLTNNIHAQRMAEDKVLHETWTWINLINMIRKDNKVNEVKGDLRNSISIVLHRVGTKLRKARTTKRYHMKL